MVKKNIAKSDTITLSIDVLESTIGLLLKECKSRGLKKVVFPREIYWFINRDDAFDISNTTPELLVGNIFDDAEMVAAIPKNLAAADGVQMTFVANILSYIAVKYPMLLPE